MSNEVQPGWYPDVEFVGGERYWDGSRWTDDRRPAGGAPGAGPTPNFAAPPHGSKHLGTAGRAFGAPLDGAASGAVPQGYNAYGAPGTAYQKSSNANTALGFSIASVVLGLCCVGVLLAIPALIMGRNELRDIDAGLVDPTGRGAAKAAVVISAIVIAIAAVLVVAYVALIVVVGAGRSAPLAMP